MRGCRSRGSALVKPGGDFVLLAEVAHVGAEAEADVGRPAAGAGEAIRGVVDEPGQNRIGLAPRSSADRRASARARDRGAAASPAVPEPRARWQAADR